MIINYFLRVLVNKSSPLAQFSIDYEEIDDDDDEQQPPQNNNDQQSWNHQAETSKYEFLIDHHG
jgi:uncharacterized protein YxeA